MRNVAIIVVPAPGPDRANHNVCHLHLRCAAPPPADFSLATFVDGLMLLQASNGEMNHWRLKITTGSTDTSPPPELPTRHQSCTVKIGGRC